jgi:hypothetical protein
MWVLNNNGQLPLFGLLSPIGDPEYISSDSFSSLIIRLNPARDISRPNPPDRLLGNQGTDDQKGHILPFLLGGVPSSSNNFFWQKTSVNNNEYKWFAETVRRVELQQATDDKNFTRITSGNTGSCPNPKSIFAVSYQVNFNYDRNSSNPLRPINYTASVSLVEWGGQFQTPRSMFFDN